MGNLSGTYSFYFLNEIWLYNVTNQIYLITLLMVFSLVAYLFVKNRREGNFELTTSEQYHFLNALTKYSDSAEIIVDNKNVIRFANERFLDLFDMSEVEIDNKKIVDVGLPDELTDILMSDNFHTKEVSFIYNHELHLIRFAPVTTEEGQLIGKLIKIKKRESGFTEEQASLWMHELNTPLNAILGCSEILSGDDTLSKTQREYLETINEHSLLLKKRIKKLLTDDDNDAVYDLAGDSRYRPIENILIVDDVPINRTLLRIILTRNGYSVTQAKHGEEAVKLCKNNSFDLVLMDLSMPVMDGVDALKLIREIDDHYSNIPIIAVTANTRYNNNQYSLQQKGFNGLIRKPFKENDLIKIVNQFKVS